MLKYKEMNPTTKGAMGVGIAIGHFASLGYVVSIPLTDNQNYDLLVEIDGKINKVQVKTTGQIINENYAVELRTICPKKLKSNHIKPFDNTKVDILIVVTENKKIYAIPSLEIKHTSQIRLTSDYDKYII